MKAGIITIGDELIQGFTINKNSSWIANSLFNDGIDVYRHISIGDDSHEIKRTLDELILDECSLIFITGGLGPTHDDITKSSLAEYFETDYKVDEFHLNTLKKTFLKKGIKFNSFQKSQAKILKCSQKINNKYGSALGMYIEFSKSDIFILPGVPYEMRKMFKHEVMPRILKKYELSKNEWTTIRTSGIYESKLYNILSPIIKKNIDKYKIAFLPHYYGVDLRISAVDKKYSKSISQLIDPMEDLISKYIYGYNNDTIGSVLFNLLLNQGITLSIAESCTGGFISKIITDYPGSSGIFLGAMVSYSNEFKNKLLKVDNNNLEKYGAVSKIVSREMCENIKKLTGSNAAISTTGISGPGGGTKGKKVGIVYITVNYETYFKTQEFNIYPKRKIHREVTSYTAMNMLRLLINKYK